MAEQIFEPGSLPSPTTYQASGAHDIVVLDCYAEFGGSGASGDYKPALRLRSQAGHIIGVAMTDETVTAGDDADVSWFRGVKAGGGGGGGGGSLAYSRGYWNTFVGDSAVAITGGGIGNRLPFAHVDADPSGAITWTQTTNPNDTANLNTAGLYTVEGNARMNTAAAGQEILVKGVNTLAEQYSQLPWKSQYNGGIIDALGVATQETHALYRVTSSPVLISLFAMSNTNVNMNFGYLAIIYHGAV